MQAKDNVIFLKEGEDVTKFDRLQESRLKELLKYQEDSSAFDSDEQITLLKNMPPDLSDKQIKLVQGFFHDNKKTQQKDFRDIRDSIEESCITIAVE